LPIYKREINDRVDFLKVEFSKYGGKFRVIAGVYLPNTDKEVSFVDFVNVGALPWDRCYTLGSREGEICRDHWFTFVKGFFFLWTDYKKPLRDLIKSLPQAEAFLKNCCKRRQP
jgi:hypothetical protein